MRRHLLFPSILLSLILSGISFEARGQIGRDEAFTQTYNEKNDTTFRKDSTDKLFSFEEYFGGLSHKREARVGNVFAGSIVLVGGMQIYNKDYWKLPIVYGGIGTMVGLGIHYNSVYKASQDNFSRYSVAKAGWDGQIGALGGSTFPQAQFPLPQSELDTRSKNLSTWMFVGAGVVYWWSLMDGTVCYKTDKKPLPGKSTIYSLLCPGLGQAYNGEFWKIPVYVGCIAGSVHFMTTNNKNYRRFKRIYNESINDPKYSQSISSETAKYWRDTYRRYRDYSILAVAGFYLLQVIDANVFAYMNDFEVTDNISLKMEPALVCPQNTYAFNPSQTGLGVRWALTF